MESFKIHIQTKEANRPRTRKVQLNRPLSPACSSKLRQSFGDLLTFRQHKHPPCSMARAARALMACASLCASRTVAFSAPSVYTAVTGTARHMQQQIQTALHSTVAGQDDIGAMRASAIKQELDKLGIKYDDCFEKSDLVSRLRQARSANPAGSTSASTASAQQSAQSSSQPPPSSSTYSSSPTTSKASSEKHGIDAMRISEIKQELDSRGVGYSDLVR